MNTDAPLTKDAWRKRARRNRVGLSIDHARVCQGLRNFLRKAPVGWIVAYRAMAGEPDLSSLLGDQSLGPFAVTRTPDVGMDLTVHPVGSDHELHRFGFCQPVADSPVVPLTEIAVVLVPGLAFDMTGNRLGHGAGYYDRFLASLRRDVVRVGVSDGFIVSALPVDAHDVAMTHLAGDMGVVAL
jgi:5-formyltetrahydrofolate cyclo-ligase